MVKHILLYGTIPALPAYSHLVFGIVPSLHLHTFSYFLHYFVNCKTYTFKKYVGCRRLYMQIKKRKGMSYILAIKCMENTRTVLEEYMYTLFSKTQCVTFSRAKKVL